MPGIELPWGRSCRFQSQTFRVISSKTASLSGARWSTSGIDPTWIKALTHQGEGDTASEMHPGLPVTYLMSRQSRRRNRRVDFLIDGVRWHNIFSIAGAVRLTPDWMFGSRRRCGGPCASAPNICPPIRAAGCRSSQRNRKTLALDRAFQGQSMPARGRWLGHRRRCL